MLITCFDPGEINLGICQIKLADNGDWKIKIWEVVSISGNPVCSYVLKRGANKGPCKRIARRKNRYGNYCPAHKPKDQITTKIKSESLDKICKRIKTVLSRQKYQSILKSDYIYIEK